MKTWKGSRDIQAVYEDGDLYKGAHGGQGLYISPSKDLVIAYFGTANIDRERNQLSIISRQLSKSGLFDLEWNDLKQRYAISSIQDIINIYK